MYTDETANLASFNVLFYANPQPMWIFDVESLKILEVNSAAIERYGYTHEEFLNKTIQDLRPPEDIFFLYDLLPSIRDNNINHREFRHITKDGKILFAEIISYSISYQGARARIVYARSMDEKRELMGKLKLTQERLLHILETMVIGFLQIDFNWTITYWNKAAEDLIGYPRQDVLEKNIWEVLPEIVHSDFHEYLEKAMTKRENVDFSDYFWPTQKWFTCNAYPTEGGIVVHFRDVTNKTLAQESLLEKIDQLKEISYLNSHAIRKPIASLLGLTQLLTRELVGIDEYKSIATLINECSLELDDVVIEVNRMVSNDDYLQPLNMVVEVFGFADFLKYVVEKVQPAYHTHDIIITDFVEQGFYGNKQALELALRYLIDNAVKFSPEANQVLIKTELVEQNIVLSVQDFGEGMDHLKLKKLFIHINQKKHVNLSSGLPKINEVCRRHHGSMWIESELGEGFVFSMRFPLSNVGAYIATGQTNFAVFQESSISIEYDEANKCLLVYWKGFQNRCLVKDGCLQVLNMLRLHKCNRILNNNCGVVGGWMEACDWIVESWFPLAEQEGLKYLAWVYSASAFSKLSTQYTIEKLRTNIDINEFKDRQSAFEWLKNC